MSSKSLKHKSPVSSGHLGVFILIFAALGGIIIWKSLAAPNPNLPGDLNGDNTVNVTDMSILLSNYGTANTAADINSDGTVNVLDLSILLSHYGQTYTSALPSIPNGLTATVGDTKVTLNWSANPSSDSVDTYQLYWGTDSAFNSFSQNLSITTNSYTLTGLTNGTVYFFRISAHNSSGYGGWNNPISATPQGGGSTSGRLSGTFNPGNGGILFRYNTSWTDSPSSGYDRYGVVVVGFGNDVDAANLPTAKALDYRMGGETDYCPNASQCLDGVPRDQADANGWVLKNSSGGTVLYSGGGTDAAADIGDANYQKAWADNTIARMNLTGVDGIFEDNMICEPYFNSTSVKYPDRATYSAAYLSFLKYVSGRFHAVNKYLLANTLCYGGNASDAAWWSQAGQYVDGMLYETFLQSNDHTQIYGSNNDWIGALSVLDAGQNAGADVYAVSFDDSLNTPARDLYYRASFLMKWNGNGGGWGLNLGNSDPWNSVLFADIGTPTGTMQQSGVGYWRQYSKGQAIVNPSPTSSVTINGHVLQPLTAYIGP